MRDGIVIGKMFEDNLEYLLTDDLELWHFESIEAAMEYLAGNKDLSESDMVFKYHIHCVECNREHFFDPSEIKTDEHGDHYPCEACQCPIGV